MDEKSKKNNEEVVTINIQPLLLPMSILLSAIIFSASFLVGMNNLASKGINTGTGTTTTTGTDTTGDTAQYPDASTSIDKDPMLGNKDAKVALVEFSDLECPFCQRHHEQTYPQIYENYIKNNKIAYVFRDFPLSFHNPMATDAAIAAECVFNQKGNDAYFNFTDGWFKNTKTNGEGLKAGVSMADLAKKAGADVSKFNTCVKNKDTAKEVQADFDAGTADGISGTPGFIIGYLQDDGSVEGVFINGAQPYSSFETALNAALDNNLDSLN